MSPRILWYSYDFANSFAGIVLIFYFPLILIERGGAELWIGITSSIATIVMLILLPRIGHFADATGKSRMVMFLSTSASVAILIALSLLFTFGQPTKEITFIALILYGLFYIGFESALTVYSGFLRTLDSSKEISATSGFG